MNERNEVEIILIVKEGNYGKYFLLAIDLGYRRSYIEKDQYKIAEYLLCSVDKLNSMEVGEYTCGSLLKLD